MGNTTEKTFEFYLNVLTEFAEFSDKNICHYSKGVWTCVRDQDGSTAPARHILKLTFLLSRLRIWRCSFENYKILNDFSSNKSIHTQLKIILVLDEVQCNQWYLY